MKEESRRRSSSADNCDELRRWKDKYYDLDRKYRQSKEDWRKSEDALIDEVNKKSNLARENEKYAADLNRERNSEIENHNQTLQMLDKMKAELDSANRRLDFFTNALQQRQPWQSPVHPSMLSTVPPPNFFYPPPPPVPPLPPPVSAPAPPPNSVLTNPEILRLKRQNAELSKQNAELNRKISEMDRDYAKRILSEDTHIEIKYQKKYHELRKEYDEFKRNAGRNDPEPQYRKNFVQQAQMIKKFQAEVEVLQLQVKELSNRNGYLERTCQELQLQLEDSKETQDNQLAEAHFTVDEATSKIETLKENIDKLARERDELEQNVS